MADNTATATTTDALARESQAVFRSQALSSAIAGSESVCERWAPERDAMRDRSLSTLSFADRLLAPFMSAALRPGNVGGGGAQSFGRHREVPHVSWVFPFPWYADELALIAAHKTAARGQRPTRSLAQQRAASPMDLAQRPMELFSAELGMGSLPLEYVAPLFSSPLASEQMQGLSQRSYGGADAATHARANAAAAMTLLTVAPGGAPRAAANDAARVGSPSAAGRQAAANTAAASSLSAAAPLSVAAPQISMPSMAAPAGTSALRAWSPLVSAPAAQAAEVVSSLLTRNVAAPRTQESSEPRFAPELAYLAPEDLAVASPDVVRKRLAAARSFDLVAPGRVVDMPEAPVARRTAAAATPGLDASASPASSPGSPESIEVDDRTVAAPTAARRDAESPDAAASAMTAAAQAESAAAPSAAAERGSAAATAGAPYAAALEGTAAAGYPATSDLRAIDIVAPHSAYLSASAAPGAQGAAGPMSIGSSQAVSDEQVTHAIARAGAIAPAGGPRVALPAGLGGLVAGLQAAEMVATPLAQRFAPAAASAAAELGEPARGFGDVGGTAAAARRPFEFAFAAQSGFADNTAQSVIERSRPAALDHMSWADRWLARFAGASPDALASFSPAAGGGMDPETRSLLRTMAPSAVYLSLAAPAAAQQQARGRAPAARADQPFLPGALPSAAAAPSAARPSDSAMIIGDDESVSDDVFAAISAAASGERRARRTGEPATTSTPTETRESITADREAAGTAFAAPAAAPFTAANASAPLADRLLRAQPGQSGVGAGLLAALGSSPVAAALAGALGLAPGQSFDSRWTAPGALAQGLLAELGMRPAAPTGVERMAARLGLAGDATAQAAGDTSADVVAGTSALATRAPARSMLQLDLSSALRAAGRTTQAAATRSDAAPGLAASAARTGRGTAAGLDPVLAAMGQGDEAASFLSPHARAAATLSSSSAPLSALAGLQPASATGAAHETAPSWDPRPGSAGRLAEAWATQRELGSSDLAYDFVTPEMVLAARAYGFGPAEAAQAQRLSVTGSGGLSALASAVDMTFLALGGGMDAARTRRAASPTQTAQPRGDVAAAEASRAAAQAGTQPLSTTAAITAAAGQQAGTEGQANAPHLPRGAFLLPDGIARQLGLRAGDADRGMPNGLAALDLLAASTVADAGIFEYVAAMSGGPAADELRRRVATRAAQPGAAAAASSAAAPGARPAGVSGDGAAAAVGEVPAWAEPFRAVYLALAREGRPLPPTVQAARALAMAGGDAGTGAANLRASDAWAMMPAVLGGDLESAAATDKLGADKKDGATRPALTMVQGGQAARGRAATRAGEALQSLVAPSSASEGRAVAARQASPAPYAAPQEIASAAAAPSPELVQTGASYADLARAVELQGQGAANAADLARQIESGAIPAWFEKAARKLLGGSMPQASSGGISLAEMTLVNAAAPRQQVAASPHLPAAARAVERAAHGGGHGEGGGAGDAAKKREEIEKLAQEVYSEICRMIEVARLRIGDPWQT